MKQKNMVRMGLNGLLAAGLAFCVVAAQGDDKGAGWPYKGPVAPFKQVISTTAVKVLPDRTTVNVPAFTAGTTYTQGTVVSSSGFWYMCVFTNAAGTAGTNYPHHASGEVSDGTNTWRRIQAGPRKGWVLHNAGTNDIRMGYGYVPTATTGAPILPGGESAPVSDTLQAAVYLIGVGSTTNGLITGLEL